MFANPLFGTFFLTNFHRNCACVLCAMCIYAVVPKGQLSCCMLYVCVCVDYSDTYVTWSVGVVRWQHASLLYQWTPYVVGGTHIYYKHQYTPSAVFIYSRRKRKLQIIGEEQAAWNRCIYDIWIFFVFFVFHFVWSKQLNTCRMTYVCGNSKYTMKA